MAANDLVSLLSKCPYIRMAKKEEREAGRVEGLRNEQYRLFLLPPISPPSLKTCRWLRTKTWRGTWGTEANAAESRRYIMCLICFPNGYVEARSEGKYRDIMMYPPRPLVMGRICFCRCKLRLRHLIKVKICPHRRFNYAVPPTENHQRSIYEKDVVGDYAIWGEWHNTEVCKRG